ncbi:DUF3137 domain-containing protein [uncultured Campylobacter sp.]|uniref:DUF3137 domain-containing protein n=1 Tax=uncultured Campylobacter sp. TaxID=218934 RepID=UPI0026166195|nr:DUF3137 domain-containing protein [uncultured Campylobacter sp.]
MDDLVLLELERQKVLRSLFRLKLVCFVLAAGVGWLFYYFSRDAILGAVAFLVCGATIYYFFESIFTDSFTFKFKRKVIRSIVESCGLTYHPGGFVENDYLYMIYDFDIDKYSGNDLIFGQIEGVRVKFSDVEAISIKEDWQGNKTHRVLFAGLLFVADFPKRLKAVTQICSGTDEFKDYGGKRARMDDAEFERYFRVYATDQIEARYALTPSLMENLKLLKMRFHRPINIVLTGDKICMAIRTGRDNFEPDLRRPLVGKGANRFYKDEIGGFLRIVEELRLNLKIWAD